MITVSEHGYLIVIERGDGNFGAWAPDLPGCVAVGDTIDECEREMREAILAWITMLFGSLKWGFFIVTIVLVLVGLVRAIMNGFRKQK